MVPSPSFRAAPEYELIIANEADYPVEIKVKIDSSKDIIMVIPSHDRTCISDVKLVETKSERTAHFDSSSAGKITIEFSKIRLNEKLPTPRVGRRGDMNDALVVDEANKNNMIFQALSSVPEQVPTDYYDYTVLEPVTDPALPDGKLVLNYRTSFTFTSAGWLPSNIMVDITEDEPQISQINPLVRPIQHTRITRALEKGKRIDKNSTVKDFLERLSNLAELTPDVLRKVCEALRKDFVDQVWQLEEITPEDWGSSYLLDVPIQKRKKVLRILTEGILWVIHRRFYLEIDDD